MNSALLKEREEFRKRAMAVPVVENKKRKIEEPAKKSSSSKPPPSTEKVKEIKLICSVVGWVVNAFYNYKKYFV